MREGVWVVRLGLKIVLVVILWRIVLRLVLLVWYFAFMLCELGRGDSVAWHVVSGFDRAGSAVFVIEIIFIHVIFLFNSVVVYYR